MKIAFAGFRHSHIIGMYNAALKNNCIAGCFEEDDETRNDMKENHNINFCFNSYDELLHSLETDTVAIGDYYQKRGSMVIEAFKAGKHVICDKPICTSLDELNEIEKLSKEKSLTVAIMLDLRYWEQSIIARDIISSGKIGNVNIISFTGQHNLAYGSRPSWYFEAGKHGGTINDIGIHGIDVIRYITGKNLSKVEFKKEWNSYAAKEPLFLDSAQFIADMEGISVMADVSYSAPPCNVLLPTYWEFRFWGDDGMLSFNLRDKKVTL